MQEFKLEENSPEIKIFKIIMNHTLRAYKDIFYSCREEIEKMDIHEGDVYLNCFSATVSSFMVEFLTDYAKDGKEQDIFLKFIHSIQTNVSANMPGIFDQEKLN
jgi:hypothetical protein